MTVGSPEYHLVSKRVAVGRLSLGTIVDSLEDLTRINAGEEPFVDGQRIDRFEDTNVEISKEIFRAANAGVAVKVLSLEGVGGEIGIDDERSTTDSFTIPSVQTTQFEPEPDDYKAAIESPKTQEFLQAVKYDPVYMITGLKVGRKLSVTNTRAVKNEGRLEIGVNVESALSLGPKFGASHSVVVTQKGEELTECVLAVRVRRLTYRKTDFLGLWGPRKVSHRSSNHGAELVGDDGGQQETRKSDLGSGFEVIDEGLAETDGEFQQFVRPGVVWLVPK
ncbi:hypothetical protein OQA88_7244 [Cercophora sp. LCS_1]